MTLDNNELAQQIVITLKRLAQNLPQANEVAGKRVTFVGRSFCGDVMSVGGQWVIDISRFKVILPKVRALK